MHPTSPRPTKDSSCTLKKFTPEERTDFQPLGPATWHQCLSSIFSPPGPTPYARCQLLQVPLGATATTIEAVRGKLLEGVQAGSLVLLLRLLVLHFLHATTVHLHLP